MMRNLGKIFLLLSTISIILFANVTASVNQKAIYKGDVVEFTIKAEGDKIKFPDIGDIGGYAIEGSSSSSSTIIINGNISKSVSKSYQFRPQKDVTIPSFKVVVDGKEYKTTPIDISVIKPTASRNGEDFVISIKTDKKEAFVGEEVKLTLTFKRKLDTKVDKLNIKEPKMENFWIKKSGEIGRRSEGDYLIEEIDYFLFPQKEGNYTIPSIEADIGRIVRERLGGGFFDDPFFNSLRVKWKKIYSNEVQINVKPLPNGLELYGDYKIEAIVDKREVKANKPINLTLKIEGVGNIDDIKKFNLDIDNTIIYADEPKIKSYLKNGVYGGEFKEKIAIISDSDYTIPPFKLTYFDKKTKQIKTIQTEPIDIKVIGGNKRENKPTLEVSPKEKKPKIEQVVKTKMIIKEEKSYIKYLTFLLGMVVGATLLFLIERIKAPKVKEKDIVTSIKKAKNDKELFKILLPFAKRDKIISETLNLLEENIYKKTKHKIDKEKVIEFFEDEE